MMQLIKNDELSIKNVDECSIKMTRGTSRRCVFNVNNWWFFNMKWKFFPWNMMLLPLRKNDNHAVLQSYTISHMLQLRHQGDSSQSDQEKDKTWSRSSSSSSMSSSSSSIISCSCSRSRSRSSTGMLELHGEVSHSSTRSVSTCLTIH